MQVRSASCLAQLSSAIRERARELSGDEEKEGEGGMKVSEPHEQVRQKPFCLHHSIKCLILLCPPQRHTHSFNMWPLRRAHSSVSSLLQQMAHRECSSVFKQTPTYPRQRTVSPLTAAESFYIPLGSSFVALRRGF